jgi:hypothetical protein
MSQERKTGEDTSLTNPTSVQEMLEKYAARHLLTTARRALVDEGEMLSEVVRDLEAVLRGWKDELLDYEQATRESKLGRRQLARLAASGEIESQGSNRTRRFQRRSLLEYRGQRERKQSSASPPDGAVAGPRTAKYDPSADARRVARLLDSSNNQEGNR